MHFRTSSYIVLVFALLNCSKDDIVYEHCQIQSYTNNYYKGFFENGRITRLETSTDNAKRTTYFEYQNEVLIKTKTVDFKGENKGSAFFYYYPDGKWRMIYDQVQLLKDSVIYEADKITVYERSYSVANADTTYGPLNPHIYNFSNGNLQTFSFFEGPQNNPYFIEGAYEYSTMEAKVDLGNLLKGFQYLPPGKNYPVKINYTAGPSYDYKYKLNSSGFPIRIEDFNFKTEIKYHCY